MVVNEEDFNEEDRWFLNNIINSVLAQSEEVCLICERIQEMNNQEMNTMTSNNQSDEERTIDDLPPSYRSILRSDNPSTQLANTTFEKQLIRELKIIKLRIIDIFRILNRCETNCCVVFYLCAILFITFFLFYLLYACTSNPSDLKTNSSLTTEKNVFDDLEKEIFNN